jgi:hypothetical protein
MKPRFRFCVLSGAILIGAPSARAADPSKVECVSANEAGQVLRQSGRLIEAEAKLATCVAASCPALVRQDCAERQSEIALAMPSIVFEVRDSAGNTLGATRTTMDGQPLPEAAGERPLRLDPGGHRFVFEVQGLSPIERTFIVREGEKSRKETIVFEVAPDRAPAPSLGVAPPAPPKEAPPLSLASAPTLAYVAAGVGFAGLALGIGAGIAGDSKHAALEGECKASACPSNDQPDINAFRTLRDWSTAGYIVAAAGVAGAAVLWLTAPRSPATETSARLWISPRMAGLAGTF